MTLRSAITSGGWIYRLARFGHAAKGLVYVVIGWLAALAATGGGGRTTGSSGAFLEILSQPLGRVLLGATGLGLAGYAVFRLLAAILDLKFVGGDRAGLAKRTGFFVTGLVYAGLAVAAFLTLSGSGSAGGNEDAWTARLMSAPFGRWLVGGLGATIVLVGILQLILACTASQAGKFDFDTFSAAKRRWIGGIASAGQIARGVVFPIMGYFLIRAALHRDPAEARDFGGALQTLAEQSYGPWLLGIVAVGLACHGIYSWVLAVYGNFGKS